MNISLLFLIIFINVINCLQIKEEQRSHKSKELSDQHLNQIQQNINAEQFDRILDKILIPRVVGTKNHKKVRNFIVNEMKGLNWDVEIDEFDDNTPLFGKLRFANVIATLNPEAKRFLVIACHYDSKYMREGEFVGATDSAVPCAMMISLAHQLNNLLETKKDDPNLSLKFIFFDGEEAFRHWGPKDSIYGARHLAKHLENKSGLLRSGEHVNELQRMDILILLDLLGMPDPNFYSYFPDTEKWYVRLAQAEERLSEMGKLRNYSKGHPQQVYFKQRSVRAHIEDDHIPFYVRNVPVLHIIPSPFPDVWHTTDDNKSAIDSSTVVNLMKIFGVFIAEYMHLDV